MKDSEASVLGPYSHHKLVESDSVANLLHIRLGLTQFKRYVYIHVAYSASLL